MIETLLLAASKGWTAFAAYKWGRTAEQNKVYKDLIDGYGVVRQNYLDSESRDNALMMAGYSRAIDAVLYKKGE